MTIGVSVPTANPIIAGLVNHESRAYLPWRQVEKTKMDYSAQT